MDAKKKELKNLAEELADVEGNIYILKDFSKQNPLSAANREEDKDSRPPKNGMTKWIIISVVCLFIFPPIAIYTFYLAYKTNKVYKEALEKWMEEGTVKNNLIEIVTSQEKRRAELIEKLDAILKERPDLDGKYWWKAGKNPAYDGALLRGKEPAEPEWNYALLNHVWFREEQDTIYLEDMMSYFVGIEAKDGLAMVSPENGAVLYRNDDLLSEKARGFQLMQLYAYAIEPIEEITKSTTRTAIDKEAERAAYQRRLDAQEIALNALGSKNLMTNQEMQMTGKMSMEEYVHEDLIRGMYEADFESKLRARGDYDERTSYSKGYHGLSRIVLYNCADVLISVEEKTNGHCAAIVVPRTRQKLIQLFVRSGKKDNPFVGTLESYAGNPGLSLLESEGDPAIRMAVDKLMDASGAKLLHLKDRNVLAEQPEGMDEYEFAYLTWRDNPKARETK